MYTAFISRSAIREFLVRRPLQTTTACVDAVLMASLAAVFFPDDRWTCPVAVLLALIPLWVNIFLSRRTGNASVFAPDPLAPNYGTFLTSFASSAEQVASGEKRCDLWVLCPVCADDGHFLTYALDFNSAKGAVSVSAPDGNVKTTTEVLFRPRLALPVTVTDTPVRIRISPANLPKQVFVSASVPVHFFWNCPYGNRMREEMLKGILSAALLIHAFFPDSAVFGVERLFIFAAILIFALFKMR